jgi:hypothetical protein
MRLYIGPGASQQPSVNIVPQHEAQLADLGAMSRSHILSEAVCVRRGSSAYQEVREGQDLIGLCPAKGMTRPKDSQKAVPEGFLIDSTMNGSEDLLMD